MSVFVYDDVIVFKDISRVANLFNNLFNTNKLNKFIHLPRINTSDHMECASASVTVLSICKKWSGRRRAYTSASPRLIRLWGRVRGHTMVTGRANTCWLAEVLDSVDFK